MATFTLVTRTREEVVETAKVDEFAKASKDREKSEDKYLKNFAQGPCICYPINFGKKPVLALFDLSSKVNIVYPAFAKELNLPIRLTDIGV